MAMTKLYFKEDLDDIFGNAKCDVPGCDCHGEDTPLVFTQRCHPTAGSRVSYLAGSGVLIVSCRRCDLVIVSVAVDSIVHAAEDYLSNGAED